MSRGITFYGTQCDLGHSTDLGIAQKQPRNISCYLVIFLCHKLAKDSSKTHRISALFCFLS